MIQISTVEEFVDFFSGNQGRGTSSTPLDVELTADLDFKGTAYADNWAGGTVTGNDWYVNFDGKGHIVKNIKYNGGDRWFLMTNLRGGYLANIFFKDMSIVSTGSTASSSNRRISLIRNIYSPVQILNVHVTGQFVMTDTAKDSQIAGICLYINSTNNQIINSSFAGMIKGGYAAGICYDPAYNGNIENCCVVATIEATNANGTATGICWDTTRVFNCFFRGILKGAKVYPLSKSTDSAICSYAVLYAGTTDTVQNVKQTGCLYDSTETQAAGITIPTDSLIPYTTAQLKNREEMANAGFQVYPAGEYTFEMASGATQTSTTKTSYFYVTAPIKIKKITVAAYCSSADGSEGEYAGSFTLAIRKGSTDLEVHRFYVHHTEPGEKDYVSADYDCSVPALSTIQIYRTGWHNSTAYYWDDMTQGYVWGHTGSGRAITQQPMNEMSMTIEIGELWKLDDYNDGYPWIVPFDVAEPQPGSTIYKKTTNGFVPVLVYKKTSGGMVPTNVYKKTANGFVQLC